MWTVKTKVISVKIRAIGNMSKYFKNYLTNLRNKHEIKELEETVLLRKCFGKYYVNVQNLIMENSITFTVSKDKEWLQH